MQGSAMGGLWIRMSCRSEESRGKKSLANAGKGKGTREISRWLRRTSTADSALGSEPRADLPSCPNLKLTSIPIEWPRALPEGWDEASGGHTNRI